MEELLEQANEVQATLGRSYAVPDEIDEADLEAGMFPSLFWIKFEKFCFVLELDALALEEEEEGPSYLADLNKVPDFVDEAPIEMGAVSLINCTLEYSANCSLDAGKARSCQDNRLGLL